MSRVCVVIPVYKKIVDPREIAALKQGLSIFHSYPLIFLCPQSFDQSGLDEYRHLHPQISFEKFSDENFTSVDAYSVLLLDPRFYQRFSAHEFMLIYQTDAYVFRDELLEWCDKNFDYIGAPWTNNSNPWFRDLISRKGGLQIGSVSFYPNAGNGGFSLRNIAKINSLMSKKINFLEAIKVRKVLRKSRTGSDKRSSFSKRIMEIVFCARFFLQKKTYGEICYYVLKREIKSAEDIVFAIAFPSIFPNFKTAKASDAVGFSFEFEAEALYNLNDSKLPFGCHAWYKVSAEFWKKFIKI
jgi:hypothetical protein